MYLFNTLLPYGQVCQKECSKGYYSSTAFEHLRKGTKGTLAEDATVFNEWTMDTVRARGREHADRHGGRDRRAHHRRMQRGGRRTPCCWSATALTCRRRCS